MTTSRRRCGTVERMSVLVTARGTSRPARPGGVGRLEVVLALAAFAVLCVVVLRVRPFLVEPDDYAYRASIVAATQGHFFTLSSAQAQALATRLGSPGGLNPGGPAPLVQWVQLANGRWISEKERSPPSIARPSRASPSTRPWANEPTPAIAVTPSAMQAMNTPKPRTPPRNSRNARRSGSQRVDGANVAEVTPSPHGLRHGATEQKMHGHIKQHR